MTVWPGARTGTCLGLSLLDCGPDTGHSLVSARRTNRAGIAWAVPNPLISKACSPKVQVS